ncbi:MAG: ABC transporter permease [Deltaproteobacteria bacterium]|jgi:putative ABC transport system permease protein|nr:ABC transporter permease [Deltaproteobacteria bacterium]
MTEKPLTLWRLSVANLSAKPWRTFGLAALVAAFSFALFAGSVIDRQLAKGLTGLSERLGADVLIVPYGYERAAKAALLRGEPSTYYMSGEVFERLKGYPGVKAATPQFFLSSLSTSCCSERVQIIAYDQETDFLIKPWLERAAPALFEGQIVAGSKLNVKVGDELFFFGKIHTVAAKMEPTGMGLDTTVLLPMSGVRALLAEIPDLAEKALGPGGIISAVALKVEDALRPKDVANAIMRDHAIEYNLDLVLPDAIVTETARRLSSFSALSDLLAAGLWVMAFLVLALVFSVSAGERKKEFGVYRLLGAKREWLGKLVTSEGVFLGLIGALSGIAIASLCVFPFNSLIFGAVGLPSLPLSAWEIISRLLAASLFGALIAPLASFWAVLKLTKETVASNLRADE